MFVCDLLFPGGICGCNAVVVRFDAKCVGEMLLPGEFLLPGRGCEQDVFGRLDSHPPGVFLLSGEFLVFTGDVVRTRLYEESQPLWDTVFAFDAGR